MLCTIVNQRIISQINGIFAGDVKLDPIIAAISIIGYNLVNDQPPRAALYRITTCRLE